jgi:hypothetical protein
MFPTIKRLGFLCRLEMPSFVKNGQAPKRRLRLDNHATSRSVRTRACSVETRLDASFGRSDPCDKPPGAS